MKLEELMQQILLLPPDQKKMILEILKEEEYQLMEGFCHLPGIDKTTAWKEMSRRAEEVVHEEKTCLIHFDDHLLSLH